MQTIESLRRTIKSAQDLQSVVKTMKALAAVSIRQYQRAVESLTDYTRTVEMGLQIILRQQKENVSVAPLYPVNRLGAIIFGSDQGLCGQLNEQIAVFAIDNMERLGVRMKDRSVITVGMRAFGYVEDMGQPIEESLTTPGSTAGITPMVQEIMMLLEDWYFISRSGTFICSTMSTSAAPPTALTCFIFCPLTVSGSRSLRKSHGPRVRFLFLPWMWMPCF